MDQLQENNKENLNHDKPLVVKTTWAKAFWKVGVPAVIIIPILIFMYKTMILPGKAAKEVAKELAEIARAFKTGTIEIEYIDHVTEVKGLTNLEVAKLKEATFFTRNEFKEYLWGTIVADAEVQIQAPIEYIFYINLNEMWSFDYKDNEVTVFAPKIRYHAPAVNVSLMTVKYIENDILINELRLKDELVTGITEKALKKAENKIKLIRELARNKTEDFVQNWFVNIRFKDSKVKPHVKKVYFADEVEDPVTNNKSDPIEDRK